MNGTTSYVNKLRGSVTMSNTIINGGASPYPKHVGPSAIASFSDGAQDAPLQSLKFSIEPKQSGSGDPSPTNVRPISGWSQVDAVAAGANLLPLRSGSTTQNGQTFTPGNGTLVINGTANANNALYLKDGTTEGNKIYLPAGTYVVSGFEDYDDVNTYVGVNVNSTSGAYTATSKSGNHTFTVAEGDYVFPRARIASGAVMDNYVLKPMIRRISDASAFAPYSGTPITIFLGQTVYGGTLDVTSGKLTVDRGYATISSFSSKSGSTANMVYAYQGITSTVKKPSADSVAVDLLSDKFVKSNFGSTGGLYGTDKLGIAVNTNGTVYVGFGKNGVSSLADANTWVAANPIQVVYPLATPIEIDLAPVSVNSLLGQNNVWASCGDTELDYYPAAASVVAVLNRSSKVYTSIPLNRIRYETYTVTPLMSLDLDSYRSESGLLIRNVLPATKCKLEFETPSMDDAALEEVWSICKAGFNNLSERKLKLKYYDTLERKYRTGNFYLPDVPTPIRNINETEGIINYGQIRFAFIEY